MPKITFSFSLNFTDSKFQAILISECINDDRLRHDGHYRDVLHHDVLHRDVHRVLSRLQPDVHKPRNFALKLQ